MHSNPAIKLQRGVRAPQIVESQIGEAEQGGPPRLAMEDDCWSIEALRDVNSLAASIALKEDFKERSNSRCGCRVSKKEGHNHETCDNSISLSVRALR
jgi:hypothetical protein